MGPWRVSPGDVHWVSLEEHPGLLTIRHTGAGEDLKLSLDRPIRLSEFPPAWEFEVDVLHSFWTKASLRKVNAAIGLNVVVTFSDPATWPEDTSQPPPDARSFQLFIVHLGSRFSSNDLKPSGTERMLVWGQGDLDPAGVLTGDWEIPTRAVGDSQQIGGPANTDGFLRLRIISPSWLSFGTRFSPDHAVLQRNVDLSQWGAITGIWEIGPIVAGSDWIQRTFPGSEPTPAGTEFYVDYADFRYAPPFPSIECMSRDFNIPGYMGLFQTEVHGLSAETWSHPGYLTMTLRGVNNYTGGSVSEGSHFGFDRYPPPWEIETAFIAPDDSVPWDFHMNWTVFDKAGGRRGGWRPGVCNNPGEGIQAGNTGNSMTSAFGVKKVNLNPNFGPNFTEPVPQEILAAKPLYMLIRMIDNRRFQMGVRAKPTDPWHLTPVYDAGFEIGVFGENAFSFFSGSGASTFQQLLIDYWHFRYGLSGDL